MRIQRTILAYFLILSAAFAGATNLPKKINFQGKLIDPATNNPKTGIFSMTFSFYKSASGGAAIYTETQPSVSVTNGVFSVQIGTVTGLDETLFVDASTYLGVTVSPDAEMTPRAQFVESPYAFTAHQLIQSSDILIAPGTRSSTFTAAGDLVMGGGIIASSGSFANGITASSGTITGAFSVGAQGLSNGTLVVQSTSAVAANPVISGRNNGGIELFRLQDDGTFVLGPAGLVSTFTNTGDLHIPFGFYAGSATFTSGVTASSGTFLASGPSQFSIATTSGIQMNAGTLDVTGSAGINASDTGIWVSTETNMNGLYMSTSTPGCSTAGCGTAMLIWLKNANAGTINAGAIVIAATPLSFNTVAGAKTDTVIGVVYGPNNCGTGAICPIAVSGVVLLTTSAAVTVGQCVMTSATAGKAESIACSTAVSDIGSAIGRWLQTTGAAGTAWARLW